MGIWSYEYDAAGNLTKQTDAKAQVLTFEYDSLNRLVKKKGLSPQAFPQPVVSVVEPAGTVPVTLASYLYDDSSKPNSLGRLSKVIDQSGSTEFFYDELGREVKSVKAINTSGAFTVERSYDALGRLTTLTYPDSSIVRYEYNPQGIESVLEGLSPPAFPQPVVSVVEPAGTVPKSPQEPVPDSSTKLLLHADGKTGSRLFTDSSLSPKSITNFGVKIDTQQKKLGLSSAFFNGQGDYLSLPDSNDFNFGAGDFTIDFWVKFNHLNHPATPVQYFMGQYDGTGNNYWLLSHQEDTNRLYLAFSKSGIYYCHWTPSLHTWYHLAFIRQGASGKIFIDGVSQAVTEQVAFRSDDVGDISSPLRIGTLTAQIEGYFFDGWLDEVRVTKGLARWTGDFTPQEVRLLPAPPEEGTVPDSFTKLLWHGDLLNGMTSSGGAKIDTRQKKFGLTSGFFDGQDDYFTLPDSQDWHLGKEDFTIDFWARFNSLPGNGRQQTLISQANGSGKQRQFIFAYQQMSGVKRFILGISYDGSGYSNILSTPYDLKPDTWYHIALVKNGNTAGTLYLFVNGAAVALSGYIDNALKDSTAYLQIGANSESGSAGDFFHGWLDELRISKGLARWTADFTPWEGLPLPGDKAQEEAVPKAYISNIDYSPTGQILKIQYGNGAQTNYTYDPNTLRLSWLNTASTQGKLQDLSYQFDSSGNVKEITDRVNTATQSFNYDYLDRLTQASGAYGSFSYEYDSIGNMLEKEGVAMAYGQNGRLPHAVTNYGGIPLSYDVNGNLVSKQGFASQGQLPPASSQGLSPQALPQAGTATEGSPERAQRVEGSPNSTTGAAPYSTTYSYDLENRLTEVKAATTVPVYDKSLTLKLKPGWNFISLPFILADSRIPAVFASILGKYSQLSQYNPSTKQFEHYVAHPDYDQFTTLEYGRGYQIYITAAEELSLTITGSLPEAKRISLKAGYNLIFSPGQSSVAEGLRPLELGVDYSYLYRYNKDQPLFDKYDSLQKGITALKLGEAYYLYCLKDTTWVPIAITPELKEASQTTTFTYDGDGGRVRKSLRGAAGAEAISTLYLGSLYEKQVEGGRSKVEVKHIFAGSNRIATLTLRASAAEGSASREAELSFFHSDHLGSSNVITDKDGRQVASYEYTPYGGFAKNSVIARSEAKQDEALTSHYFTGKELDSSTNLYYYGARYYNPQLGRFISPDSLVQSPYDPQSLNRYSYCRNNPINYVDPTGHSWKSFWKKFGGTVLSIVGVVLAPFTAGLSLWAVSIYSGIQAAQAGQFGAWAAGFAISMALGGILPVGDFANPLMQVGMGALRGAAIGAVSGGIASVIGGGSFGAGALQGAIGGAEGGAISGFYSTQQFQNWKAGNGFVSNRTLAARQATNALNVTGVQTQRIELYKRSLAVDKLGIEREHPFAKFSDDTYIETEAVKLDNGNIVKDIFRGPLSNMSKATQRYMANNPVPDKIYSVDTVIFENNMASYINANKGQPYRVDWLGRINDGRYTDSRELIDILDQSGVR